MCRTGGRRCPSSRPASHGGTRGRSRPAAAQQGDTTPSGGSADPPPGGIHHPDGGTAPLPRPSAVNYAAPTATVGGQYDDVHIGGITFTPGGIVVTGPITGTPSAPPTPAQTAAAEAAAARAVEAARSAAHAAKTASQRAAEGDTAANIAGSGQNIAVQAGHVTGTVRARIYTPGRRPT